MQPADRPGALERPDDRPVAGYEVPREHDVDLNGAGDAVGSGARERLGAPSRFADHHGDRDQPAERRHGDQETERTQHPTRPPYDEPDHTTGHHECAREHHPSRAPGHAHEHRGADPGSRHRTGHPQVAHTRREVHCHTRSRSDPDEVAEVREPAVTDAAHVEQVLHCAEPAVFVPPRQDPAGERRPDARERLERRLVSGVQVDDHVTGPGPDAGTGTGTGTDTAAA